MSVILRIFLPLALLTSWYTTPENPPISELPASPEEVVTPFECADHFYGTADGDWLSIDFDGSFSIIGNIPGGNANATGYNPVDDFLYTMAGENLLRLRADGTSDNLGDLGIPGFGLLSVGAFDEAGNFYVKRGGNANIFRVDVTVPSFVALNPAGNFLAADWAYHPAQQQFYGVGGTNLYAYNPSTNSVSSTPLTGFQPGENGTYGAAWYSDDFIFVQANNSGNLYLVDVNNNEIVYVLEGPLNTGSLDGASCSSTLAPFPWIYCMDDEFCANAVGPTDYPILDNDLIHLTDFDGNTFVLTDPPNLGTVVFNPFTGAISYTYNGAPGPDEFTYRICGQANPPLVCHEATVTVNPAPGATFPNYGPYCQGDTPPDLPLISLEGTPGTWSPSTIDTDSPGFTEYVFTPDATGECVFSSSVFIIVNPTVTSQFNLQDVFCQGDAIPTLPTTSDNNISGTWSPTVIDPNNSGTYVWTPMGIICGANDTLNVTILPSSTSVFTLTDQYCAGATVDALPTADNNGITGSWSPTTIDNQNDGMYVFTPDPGQCGGNDTLNVTITQPTDPVFSFDTTYCSGDMVDILPTTSDNGITGSWLPDTIDNQTSASYTFTPTGSFCANSVVVDVIITPTLDPTFSFTTEYCAGFTPDVLPDTSDNGVPGSWLPATIDNQNSGTYVFTPNAEECATSQSIDVTINSSVPSVFTLATDYCQGATVEVLPTTDNNGVPGSWLPTTIDNMASGSYVFTPNAAQCVSPFTLDVTVEVPTDPIFSFTTVYCPGDAVDALPTTSDNGVSGTWLPSVIDDQANGTYVFTPDGAVCANSTSVDVTVDQPQAPSFSFTTTYCAGEVVDALPTTSDNGVAGTWSPATIDNQSSDTYTFTPDAGICATSLDVNVTITPIPVISFDLPSQICEGTAAPTLPPADQNGVTGSWMPAIVDNQNDGTYLFTPDGSTPCAQPFTLNISIVQPAQPAFTLNTNYCAGAMVDVLPTTSDNGVIGSWVPATIDNQASNSYTFTPDATGCSSPVTINVTIDQPATPGFTLTTTYCAGSTVDVLPTTSDNGIAGSWSPAVIDDQNSGTYTFTPANGICANTVMVDVQIDSIPLISFALPDQLCQGDAVPTLPPADQNGITGSWSPAVVDNQATGNYTFTPDGGQCASPIMRTITVNNPPVLDLQVGTPIDCNGGTGSLNLGIAGAGGYTFTWSDPSLNGQQNPSGLPPDTYAVTVQDANGCLDSTSIVLTEPTPLTLDCSDTINPSVILAMDGAVNLVFGGGTPGYTIAWDGQQSGTANSAGPGFTIDNLAAGNYSVTLTDANDCFIECTFELENPGCDLAVVANPTNPTCSTFDNGSIDLDITGTLPAQTIDWDDDNLDGIEDPTGLTVGTYNVTITDIANCMATATITLTAPDPVASTFSLTTDFCAGDAVPTLPTTSDNGIAGSWMPATIDNQNSGNYTFTPNSDECAEPFELSVTITPLVSPAFMITTTYCQDDAPDLLPTTSDNGVTGSWSPAAINNQASDTYTFTPDGGQCAVSFSLDVTIDPLITPAFSFGTEYCQGDAVATLPTVADNGISGNWSPATISDQTSDIYTFTPTDGQCAVVAQITVDINQPPVLNLFPSRAVSCNGGTDAALEMSVNGNGPFTFDWSDDSLDGQQSPAGLAAGTFSVTVTDANGCSSTASTSVSEPASLELSCTVDVDPSRPELSDGSAIIAVGGGSSGYQLSWTGPLSGNTVLAAAGDFPIRDLPAGVYQLELTDANGCTTNCSFTLTAPQGCNLRATPVGVEAICGTTIGSIVLDGITNGDGFYEYSLDGETYNLVGEFPFSISVEADANYTLWLQDGDGCPSTWEVFVPAAREYILDLGMDRTIRLGDSIRINPQLNFFAVAGAWSDTSSITSIDGLSVFAKPLQTTDYTLTLIDSLGCSATDNIRIVVDRREAVYIPNAFSPNEDGINDNLTVFADNTVAVVDRFLVFDRWGEPVFENYDFLPNDLAQGWDGVHRSEKANVGVYVYIVEVTKVDGTKVLFKGDVSLLR